RGLYGLHVWWAMRSRGHRGFIELPLFSLFSLFSLVPACETRQARRAVQGSCIDGAALKVLRAVLARTAGWGIKFPTPQYQCGGRFEGINGGRGGHPVYSEVCVCCHL
ncbi:hypothetical protein B0H16DRAFT_1588179, partial [Mycena metata]